MSFLQSAAFWFKDRSDFTHHACVLSGTAIGVALLRKASPVALAATSIGAIGLQFGTQAWIGTVAGPTMILNMKSREAFGDIQARLFPKMGMVCTSTSILAMTAYQLAHPTPDRISRLLLATTGTHLTLAFIFMPVTAYYQYEMRKYKKGDEEYKKNAMMFGVFHLASMLCSWGTMTMNAYFIYSIAKRVVRVW